MNAALLRFDHWWLAPAPALRLAVVRVLVGAFVACILAVRGIQYASVGSLAPERFDGVGIASLLWTPLSPSIAALAVVVTGALSIAFTLGWRFRWTGPAFAIALLWITSYRNSWGHLSHGENLFVLHALVLGFAPAADAWSRDAAARGRRHDNAARYGWPLRLMAVITVLTYALAGLSKLRFGGAAWLGGDAVWLHVAFDALRRARFGAAPSGLMSLLLAHGWAFGAVGLATLCVELGAPLALVSRRWAAAWTAAAVGMHIGIAAVMGLVFAYPLALVAFAPLFRVERMLAYARRRVRR